MPHQDVMLVQVRANDYISWDAESLDKWLADPDKVVPDTDMAFHVDKADERRDIIAYLKEISGK